MKHHIAYISVLCLAIMAPVHGHEHHDHEGDWHVLFDGTNADQWRGYNKEALPAGWVVEDGSLFRKAGGGDIITKEQFADFELVFEWKVAEAGNSGVMYRVSEGDHAPYVSGAEYQILDNGTHTDGKNKMTSAGALYGMYETDLAAAKPFGEWNQARIVLNGNQVQHWLNGQKVVDCEQGSEDWNQRLAASKFASWEKFAKNRAGHIALQDHGDPVWYRNLRICKLGASDHDHDKHDKHEHDEHHDEDHDEHHDHDHDHHHQQGDNDGEHKSDTPQ